MNLHAFLPGGFFDKIFGIYPIKTSYINSFVKYSQYQRKIEYRVHVPGYITRVHPIKPFEWNRIKDRAQYLEMRHQRHRWTFISDEEDRNELTRLNYLWDRVRKLQTDNLSHSLLCEWVKQNETVRNNNHNHTKWFPVLIKSDFRRIVESSEPR